MDGIVKTTKQKLQSFSEALPVKKFANLTKLVSSVLAEFTEELEPPDGLRGTCNVEERRLCFSSNKA